MTRCAPCSARRIFAKARWLSRRNARHAGAANRNATMDLNWSDADLAFRDEVRAFLADAVDDDLRAAGTRMTSVYPDHHASIALQKKLHARGWGAPSWPREYGGCEWRDRKSTRLNSSH